MLFQTIIQGLMMRKRAKKSSPDKDMSPMAQSIMQKLAEHDKNQSLNQDLANQPENPSSTASKSPSTK
jgi:hypothetical protein